MLLVLVLLVSGFSDFLGGFWGGPYKYFTSGDQHFWLNKCTSYFCARASSIKEGLVGGRIVFAKMVRQVINKQTKAQPKGPCETPLNEGHLLSFSPKEL